MKEIRGICLNVTAHGEHIRIVMRIERGDNYQWFTFPGDKPLNRGQIIKFLGEQLGCPPGEITWPPHVKIPDV